jgi:putative AbiEii toxin of type IV toxin-antitoxin system
LTLVGTEENPAEGTVNWLNREILRVDTVYPQLLQEARQQRIDASRVILDKKKALLSFYNNIKRAIDAEIASFGSDLQDYAITIDAGLRMAPALLDEFFGFVSQSARGSFHGTEDGKTRLKDIVQRVSDWQDDTAVFGALEQLVQALDEDQRSDGATDSRRRDIDSQLKKGKDPVAFYDYLFGLSYLQAKYDLKVDGKDLSALSAGERGGLLLIFYLMLDTRDIPLVIDQPEDNLDNKSVYEILVKFLKRAKQRRQIIIATHNPNLAVVADAEQIIRVSINKKNQNDFSFVAGAIEDANVNKLVVDILEGTYPAFDNRRLKYRRR